MLNKHPNSNEKAINPSNVCVAAAEELSQLLNLTQSQFQGISIRREHVLFSAPCDRLSLLAERLETDVEFADLSPRNCPPMNPAEMISSKSLFAGDQKQMGKPLRRRE